MVCSWDSDAEVAGSILGVGFSAQPDHNNHGFVPASEDEPTNHGFVPASGDERTPPRDARVELRL